MPQALLIVAQAALHIFQRVEQRSGFIAAFGVDRIIEFPLGNTLGNIGGGGDGLGHGMVNQPKQQQHGTAHTDNGQDQVFLFNQRNPDLDCG